MRHECYKCHKQTVKNLINKFNPGKDLSKELEQEIENLLRKEKDLPNPYLATYIHRIARQKIDHNDLFREEKIHANDLLLKNYDHWKEKVANSTGPLHYAAKLAVAGNIIDYGAHTAEKEVEQQISLLIRNDFTIDESENLFNAVHNAGSVLYLGDNAGEIVFDKLFIETLDHPNLTYAVRGHPVINDVTIEDAHYTGMNKICNIISNGNDAPSTLLELCSEEFLDHFHSSEVIISKGQGNFEGLMNTDKENIYFMLMAKCDPIAELIHVPKGSLLIAKSKNTKNAS